MLKDISLFASERKKKKGKKMAKQKIIPECVHKIAELVEIRKAQNLDFKISVDGGINEKTIQDVIDAGADVIVSGSAFFSGRL